VELKLGVEKIRSHGFRVSVHPQCKKSDLFFAGTDEERSSAFFEYAMSDEYSALWCARGGSGAIRLLPFLKTFAAQRGIPPKKLLIGYSDATVLMEYVRRHWGWSILHAPMPSMRKFPLISDLDWSALTQWVDQRPSSAPWQDVRLSFWVNPPQAPIQGDLLGGNLTVWNGLLGTPYAPRPGKSLLFFEDVDENLYRIDRMLQQQVLSGAWDQVKALVLGNFLNCRDYAPLVLKASPSSRSMKRVLTTPTPQELKPLRKSFAEQEALKKIWSDVGHRLGVPVAFGLPVGHGPEVSPLPLGASYRLSPQGRLELLKWDWLNF
jgi:muramoyltetrapeptide carboxypeptidase